MKLRIIAKQKKEQKKIAKERILQLFEQAEKRFKESPGLADRYVELARKLSMKSKVRIPSELKRRFCKHCHKYLVPSKNLRVRLQGSKVVYYCLNCKKFMRFPYLREKKLRKGKEKK